MATNSISTVTTRVSRTTLLLALNVRLQSLLTQQLTATTRSGEDIFESLMSSMSSTNCFQPKLPSICCKNLTSYPVKKTREKKVTMMMMMKKKKQRQEMKRTLYSTVN